MGSRHAKAANLQQQDFSESVSSVTSPPLSQVVDDSSPTCEDKNVEEKWDEQGAVMAVVSVQDERIGAASPLALIARNPFLIRDLWLFYVHENVEPPVAEEIWAWGRNSSGQLGVGDLEYRGEPTESTTFHGKHIKSVAAGNDHTMVVLENGELWAMGWNYYGQLGVEHRYDVCIPQQVMGLAGKNVVAVACGAACTFALLDSGELFTWGIHVGSVNRTPVLALSGKHITAISCGSFHAIALLENGDVFTWGSNEHGELGQGDIDKRTMPTQVMALAGKHAISIVCGYHHSAAVLDNGELFMWGWNEHGMLGLGDCHNRNVPTQVTALSELRVVAVACATGEVVGCGCNQHGQLDFNNLNYAIELPQTIFFFGDFRVTSIFAGGFRTAVILGELVIAGKSELQKPAEPPTLQHFPAFAGKHALAVTLSIETSFALAN